VDPIVAFGACDLAFGGLRIPVLTVKALGVIIIVNYLITVITSIFENSLTFFAFLPHLFVPFFSKDRNLLLFFLLSHSFAVNNSFLCSKEMRIGVLHLFHDTLFLSCPMFGIGMISKGV